MKKISLARFKHECRIGDFNQFDFTKTRDYVAFRGRRVWMPIYDNTTENDFVEGAYQYFKRKYWDKENDKIYVTHKESDEDEQNNQILFKHEPEFGSFAWDIWNEHSN